MSEQVIVKMDQDQYMLELTATGGKRVTGVISNTLRKMQLGDKWMVPPFVSMASVKAICTQMNRKTPYCVLRVRCTKHEKSVMCLQRDT